MARPGVEPGTPRSSGAPEHGPRDPQQLGDVGEIEDLIGTRLIFGQETVAEARRSLELLGLDAD